MGEIVVGRKTQARGKKAFWKVWSQLWSNRESVLKLIALVQVGIGAFTIFFACSSSQMPGQRKKSPSRASKPFTSLQLLWETLNAIFLRGELLVIYFKHSKAYFFSLLPCKRIYSEVGVSLHFRILLAVRSSVWLLGMPISGQGRVKRGGFDFRDTYESHF